VGGRLSRGLTVGREAASRGLRYGLRVDGTHAIGVDLGGTKILAGVVTRDGEVVRRHERPTPTDSQARLLAEVDAAIETLRADDGVGAIGLGIPGTIDQAGGRIYVATNIPLADVGLRDRMQERFGVPVGLDNDANAAAIGEWKAGAARGATDVVMLTLGTGVGGGVISGGAPFRGGGGAGVELGHTVVLAHGPTPTRTGSSGSPTRATRRRRRSSPGSATTSASRWARSRTSSTRS
jgi:glucokinase